MTLPDFQPDRKHTLTEWQIMELMVSTWERCVEVRQDGFNERAAAADEFFAERLAALEEKPDA